MEDKEPRLSAKGEKWIAYLFICLTIQNPVKKFKSSDFNISEFLEIILSNNIGGMLFRQFAGTEMFISPLDCFYKSM